MVTNLEVEGRLRLWSSALREALTCILLSQRANDSLVQDSGAISWDGAFIGYCGNSRTNRSEEIFLNINDQLKSSVGTFPSWLESHEISSQLLCMAAIWFCQLKNIGYVKDGLVAKNSPDFVEDHLAEVIDKAFPESKSKSKFECLFSQIKNARDKIIAHADGIASEMDRQPNLVSHKIPSSALEQVDVEYWRDSTFLLRLAIEDYIQEIASNH